jgi:hypothetical protein
MLFPLSQAGYALAQRGLSHGASRHRYGVAVSDWLIT